MPPAPRPAWPLWAWYGWMAFCAVLLVAFVPVTTAVYDIDLAAALVISTAQCASLMLAVAKPIWGSIVQLAAIIALALATTDGDLTIWPLPVTGMIALGALVLLLGLRERWTTSLSVWWVSIVTLVALIAASPSRRDTPDQWSINLIVYSSYTVMVLIAAIALGQRARIRADLARARRDIELEHAKRLYVEERARIARELHDVVAHSMSLVHMQAVSAPFRLHGAAASAIDDEFDSIARSARTALAEMRQLLRALRPDDDDGELMPQPQLTELGELVDATSNAGTDVTLHLPDAARDASPIVQLTIYRVVQEALSNVIRHAAGAATHVDITIEHDRLHLTIENAPTRTTTATEIDHGGHGLQGMRERVQLVGGRVSAAPTAEGGYRVAAEIPVTPRRNETS